MTCAFLVRWDQVGQQMHISHPMCAYNEALGRHSLVRISSRQDEIEVCLEEGEQPAHDIRKMALRLPVGHTLACTGRNNDNLFDKHARNYSMCTNTLSNTTHRETKPLLTSVETDPTCCTSPAPHTIVRPTKSQILIITKDWSHKALSRPRPACPAGRTTS